MSPSPAPNARTGTENTHFRQLRDDNFRRTDRLFAGLLAAQWAAGIVLALVVSPRTWAGAESAPHLHLYAAVGLGGLIALLPIALAWRRPGRTLTRHSIAAAQMLFSALLIHLTGGRIETHFHIFASLAILAFYHDWRVLVTATVVVAADHVVRGLLWPASVFGVLTASPWRIAEHAGYVVFEVAFLVRATLATTRAQLRMALQQTELEVRHAEVERMMTDLEAEKRHAEAQAGEARTMTERVEHQQRELGEHVEELLEQMERFAAGDLSVRLDVAREDALGRLYDGFNRAVANMRGLLGQVQETASATFAAAEEINRATASLTDASRDQSAQARRATDAVHRLSATIEENTHGAASTVEAARQSDRAAHEGDAVVAQAVDRIRGLTRLMHSSTETIERLSRSGEEIGQIVQVIDAIADQTNMLALNAAIEAARAGEQGRGFAVVADEVRKLAERTTRATQEVTGLIRTIQQETSAAVAAMTQGSREIDETLHLADRAGQSLQAIVGGTSETIDRVTQIAAAGEAQAATSGQMTDAVAAMTQVVEQADAHITRIAATMTHLTDLTDRLNELVARFRTEPEAAPGAPARSGDGHPSAAPRAVAVRA